MTALSEQLSLDVSLEREKDTWMDKVTENDGNIYITKFYSNRFLNKQRGTETKRTKSKAPKEDSDKFCGKMQYPSESVIRILLVRLQWSFVVMRSIQKAYIDGRKRIEDISIIINYNKTNISIIVRIYDFE